MIICNLVLKMFIVQSIIHKIVKKMVYNEHEPTAIYMYLQKKIVQTELLNQLQYGCKLKIVKNYTLIS